MVPSRRTALAAGALLAAAPKAVFAQAPSVLATTRHGPVRGDVQDAICVFKGVRYGADTAPRRFRPPAPPAPWRTPAEAFDYGPASPQGGREAPRSEDCLFLNVWTPAVRDRGRRPVMVYLHGGAYATGSGSSPLYDGTRLARRGDVVVVTVNHRLNAFGYAYLARFGRPELADSGNVGQLDIVLALRWVRDNIAEFGGDPGNVTLFGQSGGGAKIATLMAMPAAAGLFHRAATMSGQQVTASGPLNATRRAEAWLEALKLRPDQAGELLTLPAQSLVEAQSARDPILPFGGIYFGPVLDERSLTRHPFYPDAPAQSAHIPMIIGNTHDETRAFLGGDEANFHLTWDEVPARLAPEMRVDISPELVVETYRRLYPHYSPSDVFFSATTAGRSWRAAIIEAEARARRGSPAFVYQLDFRAPEKGGRMGAFHTLDIPLVFDNVAAPGSRTGSSPQAQRVADLMSEAFLAFARTGDPNHAGLPPWEPYGLDRRQTMIFDTSPRLADDPRGAERELFAKVPYIQPGT
ncbi:MAG: carboxylesterase/lipase family protein [Phenylobacterium sp.]|uniref:carboxylesterase/lipase family protein n=1 Tax=Phenylobacterium sp. TaxID=1871053 RepID=UPI003919AF21